MVFLANFPFHWAVLRPPEGGSRIFCSISGAVAVVVDILRPSKTVFFLFITVRHFLGPVATPPGQAPSVSKVGTGVACAVARPDGVRPPSGCPGGAIVSTDKAVLNGYSDFRGYPEGRRRSWTWGRMRRCASGRSPDAVGLSRRGDCTYGRGYPKRVLRPPF